MATKTVLIEFEDLEITTEVAASVRFYLDRHATEVDKVYTVDEFQRTVSYRKYTMKFEVRGDFGPGTDAISGINARMYETTSTCDNGEAMRREVGDAVILWSDVAAMRNGGEVTFEDYPAELEDSMETVGKAMEVRGWMRFKSVRVEVSDGSTLTKNKWTVAESQKILTDYVTKTYEIYSARNAWRGWKPRLEKFHSFVVPFYALNRGVVTPSACVSMMHQFEGVADEVFYRNLVLVALYELGMHPIEFINAEVGTDAFVRAIEVTMRALAIVPTIFPYASDTAREAHAESDDHASLKRTKQGFEFQKQEKKKGKITIDRASFDFYVNGFDCEDGSMTVYRLWMQITRLKNVWMDPLVSKAASILDRFVILVHKVVCMGDLSVDHPAGEMCHILSVAVSRQYLSHMLANVPRNLRDYADATVNWPAEMYFKSNETWRIKRAPPIEYERPKTKLPAPVRLINMNIPGTFYHEDCVYPHVWTIEPTTPTTNMHGPWDQKYPGMAMRGMKELEEKIRSVQWWHENVGKDSRLRKVPVNANYPIPMSTPDALADPRNNNTSGFYNAYISTYVPGPAVVRELYPKMKMAMFVDVVLTAESNRVGVYHNELVCASNNLRLVPSTAITREELAAAFRVVDAGKIVSSPQAPMVLTNMESPVNPVQLPPPIILNPYDVDDESGSRTPGGAAVSRVTLPRATDIVRAEFPVLVNDGPKYRSRVVYVVKE